jgi:hypothetical protein
MRSLPPESDNNPPPEEPAATDFQSLSTAVSERPRARQVVVTDLESLRKGMLSPVKRFQHRTATDYLIDVLTPTMIFLMVYTVIFFLLDVRYIYTEVHDPSLRWVAFCFIMGIVALNRLIASEGSEESMLYIVGLAGAIGMYTLATTEMYGVGSLSRNFMNTSPWLATGFNMLIVVFVWWVTNRLMHECCVDENPAAGDIGILTGTFRRVQRAIARKPELVERHRQRKQMLEGNVIEAYDPTEWKRPEPKRAAEALTASKRLSKRHPGISVFYFSVPVMAIFVLGLPVVRQGGEQMVKAGHFYMGCYTVSALMLLMLTSLGGLREYFRTRRVRIPGGLGPFWVGLGVMMIAAVVVGATQLPRPALPPMAYVDQHQVDYWSRGSRFELLTTAATPIQMMEQSRFVERVGQTVLVVLGLFVTYSVLKMAGSAAAALARRRDLLPPVVRRFFDRLDRLLQRLTHIPSLPRMTRRIRVSRDIATCAEYRNPMGKVSPARPLGPADMVAYTYDALCALAYDLGVPREQGQTPYEFLEAFPKELESLKEEAVELTHMHVLSAYAGRELDATALDRLRKFWLAYERIRRRVVR